VLQPWIEKLNAELGLPIRFDKSEYSQFRNVRGTFFLLEHALKQTDNEAAASMETQKETEAGSGAD
jgi:hypothetical protein